MISRRVSDRAPRSYFSWMIREIKVRSSDVMVSFWRYVVVCLCNVMWFGVLCCDVVWCDVLCCVIRNELYCLASCYDVLCCNVFWCGVICVVMLCDVLWYDVMLCDMLWCDVLRMFRCVVGCLMCACGRACVYMYSCVFECAHLPGRTNERLICVYSVSRWRRPSSCQQRRVSCQCLSFGHVAADALLLTYEIQTCKCRRVYLEA